MTRETREYLREFEDSIYDLVETGPWEKLEEKMDQDPTFTSVLLSYVEAYLAEEKGWDDRSRITKKTHPNKKARTLAEADAHQAHLAAIERKKQAGLAVTAAFLGEQGMKYAMRREKARLDAWERAVQAGRL
jgi:hypothetical protein